MDQQILDYLRTSTKVRPAQDLIFTNKGVPTGRVIEAGIESVHHEVCPDNFIIDCVIAVFNMPKEKQYVSWAGTTIIWDNVTADVEKFDYFIGERWVSWSEIEASQNYV